MNIPPGAHQRFWEKVDKNGPVQAHCSDIGECWQWTASKNQDGYGLFGISGGVFRAHRVSYAIAFGDPLPGLKILHKCDNPSCVRPSHLFQGTQLENVRDMEAKGRSVRPKREQSGLSKLTDAQVEEIRGLLGVLPQRKLGKMFGVGHTTISDIKLGKRGFSSV